MKKLFLYILLLFITSGNIFSKDMIRADIAHDNIKRVVLYKLPKLIFNRLKIFAII